MISFTGKTFVLRWRFFIIFGVLGILITSIVWQFSLSDGRLSIQKGFETEKQLTSINNLSRLSVFPEKEKQPTDELTRRKPLSAKEKQRNDDLWKSLFFYGEKAN